MTLVSKSVICLKHNFILTDKLKVVVYYKALEKIELLLNLLIIALNNYKIIGSIFLLKEYWSFF